jgi:hypothetical protein
MKLLNFWIFIGLMATIPHTYAKPNYCNDVNPLNDVIVKTILEIDGVSSLIR